MNGWNRVWRSPVLDVAAALIALVHVVWIAVLLPTRTFSYDFNHYYVASRVLLEGDNPYRTPLAAESEKYGFAHSPSIAVATNPPLLLWLLTPLVMLPPRPAFWVWVAVQAGSLAAILWLTRHLLNGQLTQRGWRFLCAGALASAPVFWHFAFAHVEMTLAAALLAAFAWHKDGKHVRACAVVLVVGMTKIYPLALLPWFVWRSTNSARKRLRNTAALLAAAAAILLVTGPALWADFFRIAVPIIGWWSVGHQFNFTLSSFVINFGQALHSGSASIEPSPLWRMAGRSVGFATILAAYAFCARAKDDEDSQFSMLCAATLVGGLTAWAYYFVLLIFPVGLVAARLAASPSWRRTFVFAALLLAMNAQGPWDKSVWGGSSVGIILLNYLPLYGLCGFCLFLAREAKAVSGGKNNRRSLSGGGDKPHV